jgi:hypothetical protein
LTPQADALASSTVTVEVDGRKLEVVGKNLRADFIGRRVQACINGLPVGKPVIIKAKTIKNGRTKTTVSVFEIEAKIPSTITVVAGSIVEIKHVTGTNGSVLLYTGTLVPESDSDNDD